MMTLKLFSLLFLFAFLPLHLFRHASPMNAPHTAFPADALLHPTPGDAPDAAPHVASNPALEPHPEYAPTFTPAWAKGAVFYQIFPERFRNGNRANDPSPDKKSPTAAAHSWTDNWYALTPEERAKSDSAKSGNARHNIYDHLTHRRYGGDLQGVLDKLDYLQRLGVDVIYFNPLFEAVSHHKYDASMFHHIDVNFGNDPEGDLKIIAAENPSKPETWQWTNADRLFLQVIAEAHRRNIRIIIDGVFNHVGRPFWAFQDVVEKQQASPYKDWFIVRSWNDAAAGTKFDYKGWWEIRALPEFRKDSTLGIAAEPREHLFAVTRRWMMPDGNAANGIDGWRLDVANEVPHVFWKDWRKLVRAIKPDAYITGELWDNAAAWLQGDEFDAVMNYPFAKASINFFIDRKNKITASQFADTLNRHLASYPAEVNHVVMNLFDSHDTDRLPSMILNPDRQYDRDSSPRDNPKYNLAKPDAAARAVQRLMALFQFTYIGAPMLYYGTESGMWSADDPDDRKPMVWDDLRYDDECTELVNGDRTRYPVVFDKDLFAYYQKLISIRKRSAALREGSFKVVQADSATDVVAFERVSGAERVVVVLNNSASSQTASLNETLSCTDLLTGKRFSPKRGVLAVKLAAKSGAALLMQK